MDATSSHPDCDCFVFCHSVLLGTSSSGFIDPDCCQDMHAMSVIYDIRRNQNSARDICL